jgi:hypothetical protein
MSRALAIATPSAERPADLLDVAIALLATARGRPPAQLATLIDASAILLDAARAEGDPIPAKTYVPRQRRRGRATGPAPAKKGRSGRQTARAKRQAGIPEPALKADAGGVSIDGREISFRGKSITLAPKEAAVAAELMRVMPNLLGHDVLAQKLWPEATREIGNVCAAQCTLSLSKSVDAIGLKVTRVRGIGAGLSEAT